LTTNFDMIVLGTGSAAPERGLHLPRVRLERGRRRFPSLWRALRATQMRPQESARRRGRANGLEQAHAGQRRLRAASLHRLAGSHPLQAHLHGPGARGCRTQLRRGRDRHAAWPCRRPWPTSARVRRRSGGHWRAFAPALSPTSCCWSQEKRWMRSA